MITRKANYNISPSTTFHVAATVREFVEYDTVDELKEILETLGGETDYIHIGGGSNILFAGDYDGVVLHCRRKGIEVIDRNDDHVMVKVDAGTVWDDFVKFTVESGFYGAENLSYIPGETGGASVQNVGAYGAEAKDIIDSVVVLDKVSGDVRRLTLEQCHYGYRDSVFKHEPGRYIVVSVYFHLGLIPRFSLEYGPLKGLAENPDLTLADVRDRVISIRRSKLPEPSELGSAGSFFKNPVVDGRKYAELKEDYPDVPSYPLPDNMVKIPAGWLIERAGLKGHRIGGAEVYTKQCLVIVNTGDATSGDIIALKDYVRDTVYSKFGIEISPEVNIVGL